MEPHEEWRLHPLGVDPWRGFYRLVEQWTARGARRLCFHSLAVGGGRQALVAPGGQRATALGL